MRHVDIKVIERSFHRNGISGEPFEVFLLDDRKNGRMVAIRFSDHPDAVAVLNVDMLAKGDISFGSNSWRGDVYNDAIRKALFDAKLAAGSGT